MPVNRKIAQIFFGLSLLLMQPNDSMAKETKTSNKQYIYSRSGHQSSSASLGITAVPAYVVFPNGNYRGIYVTSAQRSGLGNRMGLLPGTVLLTVNKRIIDSPSSVDNIVNKGYIFEYSYAKMKSGVPVIINGQCSASEQSSSYGLPQGQKRKALPDASITELEAHMVDLINKDRAQNGGLPAVRQNSALTQLARNYAEYMLKHGNFSHVDPDGRSPQDRAKQAGLTVGVNENLAFQSRGARPDIQLVDTAEAQMMDEPPNQMNHRGNILHPSRQFVGVGIARNERMLMMVQELTDQSP